MPGLERILLFVYFLALSMDLVHVQLFLFKLKIAHIIGGLSFLLFFLLRRSLVLERRLWFSFLFLLSSMLLSLLFAKSIGRSLTYAGVYLFTFCCYFVLPFNLCRIYAWEKIFKLYFASFLCIGGYALCQFLLSLCGVDDPIALQRIGGIARGQALCHEPSFYALYAISFVMFYNAYFFLAQEKKRVWTLVGVNLLLLASTTTTSVVAYLALMVCLLVYSSFKRMRPYLGEFRRAFLSLTLFLLAIFSVVAVALKEIFLKSFFKYLHVGFWVHESFYERWESIVDAWDLFLTHPLFGLGIGGVGLELYEKGGGDPGKGVEIEDLVLFEPKNLGSEMLASLGVFGAVCFAFLFFNLWRIFQKALDSAAASEKDRRVLLSLLLSLCTVLLCLQINQGLFRSYVWVHAALTVGFALRMQQGPVLR